MGDFIGRKNELALLRRIREQRGSALIPVFGRRRVGKSRLILEVLSERGGIYFLGKQAGAAVQMGEFLDEAARFLDEPLLAQASMRSWKEALVAVTGRWKGPGKLMLVLDEFQWIVGASPELPSVLQELWDMQWKARGDIVLILCGSYMGFMEKEVLGEKSPLHGRRTAQILLGPFGYLEAKDFHPGYSLVDSARTYMVCGGIPMYLEQFDAGRSFEMNVRECLLGEFSPLFREPEFLLREELREIANYALILMTLAVGSLPGKDIASRTGIDQRKLAYYLGQLHDLGFVRKRYPLTGRPPSGRKVRYAIGDPLLRFWFRFVYPNTSSIARMGEAESYAVLVKPHLDAYLGTCFEQMCREALAGIYAREGVKGRYEIGEYWDSRSQIDVVGVRDDGWVDLCECKWGSVPAAASLANDLDRKAEGYPKARGSTIARRLFTGKASRQGQRKASAGGNILVHGLEDIYGR